MANLVGKSISSLHNLGDYFYTGRTATVLTTKDENGTVLKNGKTTVILKPSTTEWDELLHTNFLGFGFQIINRDAYKTAGNIRLSNVVIKYPDNNIGVIDTALENIIAAQESLINGAN